MRSKSNLSDLTSFRDVTQLVEQRWTTVVCLDSGELPSKQIFNNVTTIVCAGFSPSCRDLLDKNVIPPFIPILIIPEATEEIGDHIIPGDRLIDQLLLPATTANFSAKIAFLKNVCRMAMEHHNHYTSHNHQLDFLSNYDGLTGLRNRRQFTKDLKQEMDVAISNQSDLTLAVFNIDLFNEININFGLDFGDSILNKIAALATDIVKRPAKCYRYSTEDFAALLPGHDLKSASQIAEKLRTNCINRMFGIGTEEISVTISVGIASYAQHNPENHEKFLIMAETALFNAKASGRNRIKAYYFPRLTELPGPPNPLVILKDKLNRILDKTRTSAIASLQHLAKSVTGQEHKKHTDRVSTYTDLLGAQIGLPPALLQTFRNSITIYTSFRFLLHDDLLSKPGKLTSDEWKIIEDLPIKLQELTDIFDYFSEERVLLLYHSENYDGSGYPEGRKGEEIPIGARMLKIVDALAAMNGERLYRKKLSPEEIVHELRQGSGKQFDPHLVLQLFKVIENNELLDIPTDHLQQVQKELTENLGNLVI